MRTTVDLPDSLFRKTKAIAALRGSTFKNLVVAALEREIGGTSRTTASRRVKLPLIHLKNGRKLDLSNFNFDDRLP